MLFQVKCLIEILRNLISSAGWVKPAGWRRALVESGYCGSECWRQVRDDLDLRCIGESQHSPPGTDGGGARRGAVRWGCVAVWWPCRWASVGLCPSSWTVQKRCSSCCSPSFYRERRRHVGVFQNNWCISINMQFGLTGRKMFLLFIHPTCSKECFPVRCVNSQTMSF